MKYLGNADVVVAYYEKTSKGHDIGQISFRDDLANLLDTSRVELVVDAEKILFKKSNNEGLKLNNNNKIQLWSLAWIAKDWEGLYTLSFDNVSGAYCIYKKDKKAFENDFKGDVFGTKKVVNQPPRKSNKAENVVINVLLDQIINITEKPEIKSLTETIKILLK